MDCAAEEQMVRMALGASPAVRSVDVDLQERAVVVLHDDGAPQGLLELLLPLGYGARLLDSRDVAAGLDVPPQGAGEQRALRLALLINAVMFVVEGASGLVAGSSALVADSLDMFADAAVYGLALYGAHLGASGQLRAARSSGVIQLVLGVAALVEVGRRLRVGGEPLSTVMAVVAATALAANLTCLRLLSRHRGGGAHMKASWIFTTNDVVANLGVLVAALLVRVFDSAVPDLVVGTTIAIVVLHGAVRILRLRS
jgi:Co/Zn/Cd efflux system component